LPYKKTSFLSVLSDILGHGKRLIRLLLPALPQVLFRLRAVGQKRERKNSSFLSLKLQTEPNPERNK
jgi:hypothetical protein